MSLGVFAGGVTIITHGYTILDDQIIDHQWMHRLGDEIANRTGNPSSVFRITYTLEYNEFTKVISLGDVETAGPWLGGSAHNGETIIILDWRDFSDLTPALKTGEIADYFIHEIFMDLFSGKYLAEQPIHLIGHSRGASMMCGMSQALGYYGLYVDQLTLLDPHPVEAGLANDADAEAYENVLFCDNYWQEVDFPRGETVSGAYNRELPLLLNGYLNNHSDIHLWYHGTVDHVGDAVAGNKTLYSTMRESWYGTGEGSGATAGFYFSRISGVGSRLQTSTPTVKDGYHNAYVSSGGGARVDLDWSHATWPNLLELEITHDGDKLSKERRHVAIGDVLSIKYTYQDYDSNVSINFYRDDDTNPYNGNSGEISALATTKTSTGKNGVSHTATWNTSGMADDPEAYVYAKIQDTHHARYLYAQPILELLNQPDIPGSQEIVEEAIADTILDEFNPDGNFGSLTYLQTKYNWTGGLGENSHILMKFDLSEIPEGSTVNDAELTLYCEYVSEADNSIYITECDTAWNETSATWNNYSGQGYDFIIIQEDVSANSLVTINNDILDDLIADQINNSNHGLVVRANKSYTAYEFRSRENAAGSKPSLTVNFTPPAPPDLIVTEVSPDEPPQEGTFYVGQSVDWNTTVKNVGSGPAPSSKVGYYIGTSSSDLSSRFDRDTIDALEFGESDGAQDSYTFTEADVGTRYVICKADYLEDFDESNESNNTKAYGPFTVVRKPPENVLGISALGMDFAALVAWRNPDDPNFQGVKIIRKTDGYPDDPNDGDEVYNGTGSDAGYYDGSTGVTYPFTYQSGLIIVDDDLSNDIEYYYTAYSYDAYGNYSSGVNTHAMPHITPTHYISFDGANEYPFSTPETATSNFQYGVVLARDGDTVFVSNGVYLLSSEIKVSQDITIQSVNGPAVTIVDGGGSNRCFNLGSTACTISGLTIMNGSTTSRGGGIYHGYLLSSPATATNCVITGNSAAYGGGIGGGVVANNCTISENSATHYGGGMYYGAANNCTIIGNSAKYGGGAYRSPANNSTIVGNSASVYGGGMRNGTAQNSIIWYNQSDGYGANLYGSVTATNSCSPDVQHGISGNITNVPVLVSASHIASNSPCIGAGNMTYATGTDIDGEPWLNPPSIGCDEYHGSESVTGEVSVVIGGTLDAEIYKPAMLVANISGNVNGHVWDFGDGTTETNNPFPVHVWESAGAYDVVLTAFNQTYPSGISDTQTVHVIVAYEDSSNFAYTTNSDDTITITDYYGSSDVLVIPDTISSLPVSVLDYRAFWGAPMSTLIMPNTVTNIGTQAFADCPNLTTVTISSNVSSIGSAPFQECIGLQMISVDQNNGFYSSIDGVLLTFDQTQLTQYPCGKAGEYTVPETVISINEYAFRYAANLASVVIPDNVVSIASYAFGSCPNLTNVVIGTVSSIHEWSFQYSENLRSITVDPANPNYCSANGILYNKSKTRLIQYGGGIAGLCEIPASVTSINHDGLMSSYLYSFSVAAGNSVYCSVDGVLFDKDKTTLVKFPGSRDGSCTIPDGTMIIGRKAFGYCKVLSTLSVPASVTTIESFAFWHCYNLTGIYFRGDAPSVGSSIFALSYDTTVYYSLDSSGWSTSFSGHPTVLWNPLINASNGTIGIHYNSFMLSVDGAGSEHIKVEACTNLTDFVWEPVAITNLTGGTVSFSDHDYTNHPTRFYRLNMP